MKKRKNVKSELKVKYDKSDEKGVSMQELEREVEKIEQEIGSVERGERIEIISSKPISQIKKGDKIKIDGIEYEVDVHYVLIDHGQTKEMAIELFDNKDKDYQLRYFSDQVETSLEFYQLDEIVYNKKPFKRIEW